MIVEETSIADLKVIIPDIFNDSRGHFFEQYHLIKYKEIIGKKIELVQDNVSLSKKNVLRGLHLQEVSQQGKLVTVIYGSIYDVVVDLRKDSKTFQSWFSVVLSQQNFKQLWVPPGFAHGFVSLENNTIVNYKCSELYNPALEKTILWNDKDLRIKWPTSQPIISEKDQKGVTLANFLLNEK